MVPIASPAQRAAQERASRTERGRLAEVVAARSGHAAPEAGLVVEHREALVYLLYQAAELEHGIMCQYLYAAFSLKQRADEGLSPTELEAVTRWRKQISHVASQEMLHLALVENLLSAIGGAPHLSRPNLPQPANHYPAGVQLLLLPFGEQALRHFMFLERPEGMELDDAEGISATGRAAPMIDAGMVVPQRQDFATVGHLYRAIEAGIDRLAAKLGADNLFVGPPRAQATRATFGWPELVSVTDVASAHRAIDEILEQGEGAQGRWQDAHFGQFVAILDEYETLCAADPGFDPVRPVLVSTVRPCEHAEGIPLIGDSLTSRCTDLFNVAYEVLLTALQRYFAHTEESDGQLATLGEVTLALMLQVIKPLGDLITTLPVGPGHPGRTAGPSFELFYENDYLLPHRAAAWFLIGERLGEAASFCASIRADTPGSSPTADVLDRVRRSLLEMAGSLGYHLGDDAAGPDWGALAERTAQLDLRVEYATVDPCRRITNRELANVYIDTRRTLDVLADPTRPDRRSLAGVAERLVESVLRPLAGSLAPAAAEDRSAAPEPPALGAPSPNGVSLEERLWQLALAATALFAHRRGPVALQEAAAALVDVALSAIPPGAEERRDERLAQLRTVVAALPSTIHTVTDGPYLVVNVPDVVDRLGEPAFGSRTAAPLLALCRCGESAVKPLCDGAHARVGFSGAKDPKRVPDQLDVHPGVELAVTDNRGLCAHSGFCTDRLQAVFHAGGEPFVTPAAGRGDDIVRAVRDCPSGALGALFGGADGPAVPDRVRPQAIEISRDGPYRVTGSVPLLDDEDADQARPSGASREHYSLCRCGHSQNKPFCSGMHWYVGFVDPQFPRTDRDPTLFEWVGGHPVLVATTRLLYGRYVLTDPVLGPLFTDAPADLAERAAARMGAALGGPADAAADCDVLMVLGAAGPDVTEAHRARWVELAQRAVADVALPAEPQFRASLAAYLDWVSRVALDQARTGGPGPATPEWGWVAGVPNPAGAEPDDPPVALPGPGEPVTFTDHVVTFFRAKDRRSMSYAFDLGAYDDVATHADAILARVAAGTMPCDGAWPTDQVEAFRSWVVAGRPR